MGHKVPQSQYFHGLWHSFFFSTVKDGIITDALVLAEHNCSFVLVAHENFSDHREVRRALKSIELVNGDLIGAVLVNSNHAISSNRKGGDGYYYGYKRKKTGRKEKAC